VASQPRKRAFLLLRRKNKKQISVKAKKKIKEDFSRSGKE